MKRSIAIFLLLALAVPALAADVNALNLNLPNIQSVSASEKALPQTSMDTAMESPVDPDSYMIGPGDQLAAHIIVGDAELSIDQNLMVGADGKVFFPNIGELYLSNLTLVQAKKKLDSSIGRIYKEKYTLSLMLTQPKKVKIYLSGMIKNPGPLTVYDNSRISEVISLAGGTASGASNRYVFIRRKGVDGADKVIRADLFAAYRGTDLAKDVRIRAGDVIEVPDAASERLSQDKTGAENDKLLFEGKESFVYVYGQVSRAGRFEYVPGKRLSDYISYAGGPADSAVLNSVTITRQVDGQPKKYTVNVSDVLYNGDSAKDIEIYGGDVINVPKNFFYFSDFPSFANTIILALTLYSTITR